MTEIPGQVEQTFGPILDPVRAAALANAVDLAHSETPILADAAIEVAAFVLTVADVFYDWLSGDSEEPPGATSP